ncbi:DUF3987 domain-containing protein [Methylicorpusculum oleiharenae]|uniref:DUF3987 domain-containing protein n=1 Tax=Methylicorpusculum oleiharenae TaxID=1338687 RepID=UPI001E2FF587|nr:DUF3987 domain-containing protein [Methylicorpusculum oleiharenae]MCD2451645.1 DUF3987 domain-containing protein [Methylicorpusculum oleiharenae]
MGAKKRRELGKNDYCSPEYPVNGLGPLKDLCKSISEKAQLDPAMVGQAIITAASLVTQGSYEVQTLSGYKPLSLYGLTIAESGDGKSTAEGIVLQGVREFEKEKHNGYMERIANESEEKGKKKNAPREIEPYLLASDSTVQGVIKSFKTGWPSQGIFTAEGATMLCGWGMSGEQRANSSANLNKLWDGESIALQRGIEGRTQLYNRRFCAHWLIQPDVAQEALNDSNLSAIGLWPRFLVAWPQALKPRLYKYYDFKSDPVVTSFWSVCKDILSEQVITGDGECGEFFTLKLTSEARAILIKTFEKMELSRDPSNPLHIIKPFAVRLCEQACRIGGVLAAFSGEKEISAETMKNALLLANYSLETWRGIFGTREDMTHELWAKNVYDWMSKRPGGRASETDLIKTVTPKHLRTAHKRDTALSILRERGLIEKAVDFTPDGVIRLSLNEWKIANGQ